MKRVFHETKNNAHYFYATLLISFLTILPQYFLSSTIRRFIAETLLLILLIAIAKFSRTLFSIFIIYINIINIFLINIYIHWNSSFNAVANRMRLATLSPKYETLEYLNTYVNYKDYLFILYVVVILFLLFQLIIKSKHEYKILKKIGLAIAIILTLLLWNKAPLNYINQYIDISNDTQLVVKRDTYLHSLPKYKNNLEENSTLYDKIIIIQGEAVNRNFMKIYGYNKNTTPYFSKLLKSKKIYKFDAIAPASQTFFAIPMIYTNANVSKWEEGFIHSQSIISDFNANGYQSYWISNQGKIGHADDYISSIAKEAKNQIFFNQIDYTTAKSDIVIKKYLDEKKYKLGKQMYVFHLIGSHGKYITRVDNEHILNKKSKNIYEEYENTIFFTDYIIKNIFQYFLQKDEKVLIVYVSDHGEVVNEKQHGHGFLPTWKDEYETPLVIYSSIPNKRIENLAEKNVDHYFNTENLNYIIKYISGISNDANISTSSNVFSLDPKNIRDYDELKFYK